MTIDQRLIEAYAEIAKLQTENQRLNDALWMLKRSMGILYIPPAELRFTPTEAKIFGRLLKGGFVSKKQMTIALYHDGNYRKDEPESEKILDVYLHKIRKKLKPYGITIHTRWGYGYELFPESRARYAELWPGFPASQQEL